MRIRFGRGFLHFLLVAGLVPAAGGTAAKGQAPARKAPAKKAAADPGPYRPTAAELAEIADKTARLGEAIKSIAPRLGDGAMARDALADAEVYHKAAVWIVRHGDFREAKDVARTLKGLDRGLERARALGEGKRPWAEPGVTGSVPRGYRSRVDGSVQPYAVIVPKAKEGEADAKQRLDVILHGRDAKLHEARFLDTHDGKPAPEGQEGLVLHVFGRVNNAYRWAGEADVYEAIDAVRRNYRVDDRRIVLRGFSMGGAGAWHLGLHNPGMWSSVEAGAGFTETMKYAKLKDPSDVVRKGLHIYDATDYALNAFDVPIVGYGGEEDTQKQASVNIEEALKALGVVMKVDGLVTTAEGPDFTRIVGKGMGHAVDKESAALMKAFHDRRATSGSNINLAKIRFETYTLKYNAVDWLRIERLAEHYKRATLDAELKGELAVVRTGNVAVLAVARDVAETIELDGGKPLPLRAAAGGLLPDAYYRKLADGWEALDYEQSRAIQQNARGEKAPGVQGPIDDAFTAPFLCVRGTGKPWNPKVQAWADARLARFSEDWNRWMRGDLPIKNDADVTEQDIEGKHLILFGDPGSNSLIARALPGLPLTWDETTVGLDGKHPAADHAPVLVAASPLNKGRYVVINSGHTFGEDAFKGSNALLYPRLGDYAVFPVGKPGEPIVGGYFDERWRKP
ncbi:alpha/beta hydrolase-fold protein [Tundrisphaera sp. TA3]|uniref:alpha/beta hydrolase-fold protein n=1 Tax=Tundrisphaera sp. TA3 TaxID=3435775 RepID=UPI003EBBFE7C